jgi:hypothetical protein
MQEPCANPATLKVVDKKYIPPYIALPRFLRANFCREEKGNKKYWGRRGKMFLYRALSDRIRDRNPTTTQPHALLSFLDS